MNKIYVNKYTNRNILFDFIKGIAIIFVVAGHSIQYGSGYIFLKYESYFYNIAFKLIYSVHMPLFMLISGYLFYQTFYKSDKIIILYNRIMKLLVPIFTWAFFTILIKITENLANGIDVNYKEIITLYLKTSLLHLWFLWSIFYCSIIIILVNHYFNDSIIAYIYIGFSMLFIPDAFNTHLYKYMYPYFIGAYLWNKYDIKSKMANMKLIIKTATFLALFLCYIILIQFYDYDSYIYTSKIFLFSNPNFMYQLGIDIFRWMIGIIGCSWIIILCIFLINKVNLYIARVAIKIISFIGKHSLGIYIISEYINIYILKKINKICCFNIIIIETIIIIICSLIISIILNKIKFTRIYLLGGR
ncbi:acyltransferase family protein [Oxobacter pfennigii]|uniref:Acyltransferase family protein n=1 Tax=Oxobacter pfennigii TaxID=36849 RepID=A0A0P9AEH7_9CLOT|nr:acyltransferase family protein [Oxobacter pfennigii]KPU43717.1 acyltransferase family protein [Oxobacter pfennigii]